MGAEHVSKHPEESKQILDKANKMEHGQWDQRSQPGTRMNWTPSVKEATTLVWSMVSRVGKVSSVRV